MSRAVTVRPALAEDARALDRLAALESRSVPPHPLLVAKVDGVVQAALSVSTGEAIADPFAPTLELVRLLEMRVVQLRAADSRRHNVRARLSPA